MRKGRQNLTDEQREANRARNRGQRARLLANSAGAKLLVDMGEYDSINEALEAMYTTGPHTEFHTFGGWLALGYGVNRGEHGFPIWGQPIDRAQDTAEGEGEETRHWPMCYLFSNAQVTAKEPRPPRA